jgi:SPP1 family phage portal protein
MGQLNTKISSLHNVPKFHVNEDQLTPKKVSELIEQHQQFQIRYELLGDYYKGKHSILNRTLDSVKPNNRLVDNYAEYITNVKSGYFMGVPVIYNMKDEATIQELKDLLDYNDEQDNNSELAKLTSIYGHAFELLYIDEDGQVRFKYINPTNMVMLYGMDIGESPVGAIRYFTLGTGSDALTFAELYLKDRILYFQGEDIKELQLVDEKSHVFGDVPVIEYLNNDERIGDFENVVSLIDAYELICSDTTNEIQYFNDAYLVVKNLMMTDDSDIQDMKNNRIIMLDDQGEANWLTKNINDTHVENLLERVKKDIHKFSHTPALTDEKFSSNLSGVAIRFKLWGLEQDTVNKERKFKKGLQRRFELIANVIALLNGSTFDYRQVKITFTRNIPNNLLELVQTVATLQGIVSQETLLSQLPFIDNVKDELEALEKEDVKQQLDFGFQSINDTKYKDNQETE